jgi:hypothetical protein
MCQIFAHLPIVLAVYIHIWRSRILVWNLISSIQLWTSLEPESI